MNDDADSNVCESVGGGVERFKVAVLCFFRLISMEMERPFFDNNNYTLLNKITIFNFFFGTNIF